MTESDNIKERHVEVGTFYHSSNGNMFFKVSDTRSVWVGNTDMERNECEIPLNDRVVAVADTNCRVFQMTYDDVKHILNEASK